MISGLYSWVVIPRIGRFLGGVLLPGGTTDRKEETTATILLYMLLPPSLWVHEDGRPIGDGDLYLQDSSYSCAIHIDSDPFDVYLEAERRPGLQL